MTESPGRVANLPAESRRQRFKKAPLESASMKVAGAGFMGVASVMLWKLPRM